MLFNSFEYLIFLPLCFLMYWYAFKSVRSQNVFLILSSYLFYGWWDYRFLAIIIFISICGYYSGLLIEREKNEGRRKLYFWINIIISLSILGVFKYFDFFSDSFARFLRLFGFEADSVTLELILPVGISFYTFQSLSYTIDVYRRKLRATGNVVTFFLYISFFPQLVAGPIERATNIIPQLEHRRKFDYGLSVSGMKLILWGLFKKMVVADNAATIVNSVFASYSHESSMNLWIGAFLFTMQIYCDFSGYSDIAIGTARLFSIRLMNNFNKPYLSHSIKDFWKKWHISLTSWFKDYVYIPLGGNRKGKYHTINNTFVVFMTSGLWHGANFTFIVWGLYHAVLYIPSIIFGRKKKDDENGVNQRRVGIFYRMPIIKSVLTMGCTFILVMIGWVIFRADHISEALHYIARMFSFTGSLHEMVGKQPLMWCVLLILIELLTRHKETPYDFSNTSIARCSVVRWSIYVVSFLAVLIFSGQPEDFIYFQF